MKASRAVTILLAGAVGVLAARCSSPGAGGDVDPPMAHCEADLSAWLHGGIGARAVVAGESDLIGGPAARGRPGDVLLANGRVRVVIEAAGRTRGPDRFGGFIIDADVVREGEGSDQFGKLGPLLQFGRTMDVQRLEILRDGSEGGSAVVAATGPDAVFDMINVPGVIDHFLPGLPFPDPDRPLGLRMTNYYVLEPDAAAVRIVQALCNDGDEPLALAAADVVDPGGEVHMFAGRSGFGGAAVDLGSIDRVTTADLSEPFALWVAEDVSYGWIGESDANQIVNLAGVTGILIDSRSLFDFVRAEDAPPPADALFIEPGSRAVISRKLVVSRQPGGVFDHYRRARDLPSRSVEGRVLRAEGAPAVGARVHVSEGDQTVQLMFTDEDGRFAGRVPTTALQLSVDDGVVRSDVQPIDAGSEVVVSDVRLPPRAKLTIRIRDDQGTPMPGKVTLRCLPDCPHPRGGAVAQQFADARLDSLPSRVFDQLYLEPDGEVQVEVPQGQYRVWVSRGPEWSLFEEDVDLGAGDEATVEATLAHVVDTAGWMSGDFHVHSINSPDSIVPNRERLRTFLGEGVDIIVSTDHEHVTDFAPVLAQIPDGDRWLRTVIGAEVTTFDYGHYNGFPLRTDPARRDGGTIDWTNAGGARLTPRELFESIKSFPGEQVVQVNHARTGMFEFLQVDMRTLWTRAPAKRFRMAELEADPDTGDTRLFDDGFTAIEIMNGNGGAHVPLMNDWFALLSRGVRRTGTAVSDTHKRHGSSGSPRTWVRVGTDDPLALELDTFVRALNAGNAFGSNGPFVLLSASAGDDAPAGPGETLVSAGRPVTVSIEVRLPSWMDASEVQLFVNATDTAAEAGRTAVGLPEPVARLSLSAGDDPLRPGAKIATAVHELDLEEDAWIVALVTGTRDMFPVVGKGGVRPRAFTNPVYVDVAGDGWTPPVDLAAERARIGQLPGVVRQQLQSLPDEATLRHVLAGECAGH